MKREIIKEKFLEALNTIDASTFTQGDTTFYELWQVGLDSIDTIDLAMEIEKKFGICIPDTDIEKWNRCTINEIIAYIDQRTLDIK